MGADGAFQREKGGVDLPGELVKLKSVIFENI